ncbi:MAG: GNAT family N-acetyltransferase [Candidatus Heimdallarchaeaceae archaeon]
MSKTSETLSYTIEEAEIDDLEEIVALWKEVIEWHATFDESFILSEEGEQIYYNYLANAIISDKQVVYKAELEGGKIIGFLFGYIKDKNMFFRKRIIAHISDITVHKDYRNQGIGTALMSKFEHDYAKRYTAKEITLYVHTANKKAISFYERAGYTKQMHLMSKRTQEE